MRREHTDREYENELGKLRDQLLLMGAKVEGMIAASVKALVDRDSELAHRLMESDNEINRLEVDTDDLCLRILAKRQPVASDLRFITIVLKLVTDLERIGDLAVNICERVIELNAEPALKPYVDLPHMAETAQGMVREALDAFVARDAERAKSVIERDRVVDAYYAQIFRELLTYMMEDQRNISRAMRLQSIAKYLERIGDHATNVAERVIFMVMGQDVRHTGRVESEHGRSIAHGVLFVCIGNAARSQMAEGWAKKLLPAGVRVWSAGTEPAAAVSPYAVTVMKEAGLDISGQKPKRLGDVPIGDIDMVVVLCEEAEGVTVPSELRRVSWPLADPGHTQGPEKDVLAAFRCVRDELKQRIQAFAKEAR
jgi:phosphate transport system protein